MEDEIKNLRKKLTNEIISFKKPLLIIKLMHSQKKISTVKKTFDELTALNTEYKGQLKKIMENFSKHKNKKPILIAEQ